jgi:hypothetical protein
LNFCFGAASGWVGVAAIVIDDGVVSKVKIGLNVRQQVKRNWGLDEFSDVINELYCIGV